MLRGKAMMTFLIFGLIKKVSLYERVIFLNPVPVVKKKIKVELDLYNYGTMLS